MKVQLPETTSTFQESLKNFLATTRSCQTGISFLAHFTGLIRALRLNPITSEWISGLEQEIRKRNETFKLEAIEALEEEWLTLWKSQKKYDSKKALLQIKRFFMPRQEPSLFLPFEACHRLFTNFRIRFKNNLHSAKFVQFLKQNQNLQFNDGELLKEDIKTSTELDPTYFWDRLCLLERVYLFTPSKLPLTPILGSWDEVKFKIWDRAIEASTHRILHLAKKELFLSFSGDGFSRAPIHSSSLGVTYQFSRRECENHLVRLQSNIIEMLLRHQPNDKESSVDPHKKKTKPERKAAEVKKHGEAFWKEDPNGKYKDAYQYYCDKCRYPKTYSFSEWGKKVRLFETDPRPRKEKRRGISKKGR